MENLSRTMAPELAASRTATHVGHLAYQCLIRLQTSIVNRKTVRYDESAGSLPTPVRRHQVPTARTLSFDVVVAQPDHAMVPANRAAAFSYQERGPRGTRHQVPGQRWTPSLGPRFRYANGLHRQMHLAQEERQTYDQSQRRDREQGADEPPERCMEHDFKKKGRDDHAL